MMMMMIVMLMEETRTSLMEIRACTMLVLRPRHKDYNPDRSTLAPSDPGIQFGVGAKVLRWACSKCCSQLSEIARHANATTSAPR
jgi:hypothetical protein